MRKILESRLTSWIAVILVTILIIITFNLRQHWWEFSDIFFIFMAAFCHAMSLTLGSINRFVGIKLDKCAWYALWLGIIAFIGEFIAIQFVS